MWERRSNLISRTRYSSVTSEDRANSQNLNISNMLLYALLLPLVLSIAQVLAVQSTYISSDTDLHYWCRFSSNRLFTDRMWLLSTRFDCRSSKSNKSRYTRWGITSIEENHWTNGARTYARDTFRKHFVVYWGELHRQIAFTGAHTLPCQNVEQIISDVRMLVIWECSKRQRKVRLG